MLAQRRKQKMYPIYDRKLFSDVYPDANKFLQDYKNYESSIDNLNKVEDKYVTLTWQLVASRFANTPIRSQSEEQFKLSVFGIMFSEAPTFVKRLDIQAKVRNLSDAELMEGETAIANAARNPATAPGTQSMDELPYIDNQNVTKQKRSKLQAYALQLSLLESDLSEPYVRKFEPLFARVIVDAEYIYPEEV